MNCQQPLLGLEFEVFAEHSGASLSTFFFTLYLQGISNTHQFSFCLTSFGDGPKIFSKQISNSFSKKKIFFFYFQVSNLCNLLLPHLFLSSLPVAKGTMQSPCLPASLHPAWVASRDIPVYGSHFFIVLNSTVL